MNYIKDDFQENIDKYIEALSFAWHLFDGYVNDSIFIFVLKPENQPRPGFFSVTRRPGMYSLSEIQQIIYIDTLTSGLQKRFGDVIVLYKFNETVLKETIGIVLATSTVNAILNIEVAPDLVYRVRQLLYNKSHFVEKAKELRIVEKISQINPDITIIDESNMSVMTSFMNIIECFNKTEVA